MTDLAGAVREAADQAHVVVLTGSESVFSAGADLSEFTGTSEDLVVEQGLADAAEAIHDAPVPVIAAIEGACLGAGVELTAACDVRLAGEGAFFEIPAARLGILYRPDGVGRLLAVGGRQLVARLFLLNERLGATDMHAAGYVGRLVPAGHAFEVAMELARHAATLVPESVTATKRLIGELATEVPAGEDWDEVRRMLLDS